MDHLRSPDVDKYAQLLAEKRKHKGVTFEKARELLEDPNYYGCLMAAAGDADGMVSGSTSSTAATIRPALQVSPYFWHQSVWITSCQLSRKETEIARTRFRAMSCWHRN